MSQDSDKFRDDIKRAERSILIMSYVGGCTALGFVIYSLMKLL